MENKDYTNFIKAKYNSKILIRIVAENAFVYLIHDDKIEIIDCVPAWNKQGIDYSKKLNKIIDKYQYDIKYIFTEETFEQMIKKLEVEFRLAEFEKSDRQFPEELFTPKSEMDSVD